MDKNLSRRRFIQATGVGALGSIAGCSSLDNLNNNSQTTSSLVLGAIPKDIELKNERDIIVPAGVLENLEVMPGQQVRLHRDLSIVGEDVSQLDNRVKPALFNIRTDSPANPESGEVLIDDDIITSIPANVGDKVQLRPYAPHPDLESRKSASSNLELVSQSVTKRRVGGGDDGYAVFAPFGGGMEINTARQAVRSASQDDVISTWYVMGYDNNPSFDRWRVPTTTINPLSYPDLGELVGLDDFGSVNNDNLFSYSGFKFGITFNGLREKGIGVSGLGDREFKEGLAANIRSMIDEDIPVTVRGAGVGRGSNPENLVNKVTDAGRNGIEITQSTYVRKNYWQEVSDAVSTTIIDREKEEN